MSKEIKLRKARSKVVIFFVFLAFFLLFLQLYRIQVYNHENYTNKAVKLRMRDIEVKAIRGQILDRNQKQLVYSLATYNLWASSSDMEGEDIAADIEKLSDVIEIDREGFYKSVEEGKKHFLVKRWVDKSLTDQIRSLGIRWIAYAEDSKRVYPFGTFASHIIGNTDGSNQGITGIEKMYQTELQGTPGKLLVDTDRNGRQLAFGNVKEFAPVNGYNIILTLDDVLQHYMEEALKQGLENSEAKRTMGVMMDVKTGEILAMASYPDYNLNDVYSLDQFTDEWFQSSLNPIVSLVYEPGSTFKLITAAAALEESVVTPFTMFDDDTGYEIVDGVKIKCYRYKNPHGEQTFTEGVVNSCNPVFIQTEAMIGKDRYYDYVEAFGFTEKTGIDLPAETGSIVIPRDKLKPVEEATMSFGHGISVTPIQVVTAISAIANDGKLMKPHIVKQIVDENGVIIKENTPVMIRQVISEKTSAEMRLIMEAVVAKGSAAAIDGIRIGGKTGTTEKLVNGAYSEDLAIASFVAIAPVEDPQIALLVIVDEPGTSNFGSVVAAPISGRILNDSLRYLGVNPVDSDDKLTVTVPDLTGMKPKQAESLLVGLNLKYTFSGLSEEDEEPVVIDQYPKPGIDVSEKSLVIIKF